MKKYPPVEKIYEAWSAVADGRVSMGTNRATVASSNRAREYVVSWDEKTYSSNDNATIWQGYAGYPVIAVLMLQDELPLDEEVAGLFKGINWTKANTEAKRDYAKAVDSVFVRLGIDETKQTEIRTKAAHVLETLKALDVAIKRSSPRKSHNSA